MPKDCFYVLSSQEPIKTFYNKCWESLENVGWGLLCFSTRAHLCFQINCHKNSISSTKNLCLKKPALIQSSAHITHTHPPQWLVLSFLSKFTYRKDSIQHCCPLYFNTSGCPSKHCLPKYANQTVRPLRMIQAGPCPRAGSRACPGRHFPAGPSMFHRLESSTCE